MTFFCFYRKIHNSSNVQSKTVWATLTERANNQNVTHVKNNTAASVTKPCMWVTVKYKMIL
jgi:hypothetical protein